MAKLDVNQAQSEIKSEDLTTEPEDDEDMEDLESDLSKQKIVRPRALISDEQVATLKAYYALNPKPRREDLTQISDEIGHPFKVVKVKKNQVTYWDSAPFWFICSTCQLFFGNDNRN